MSKNSAMQLQLQHIGFTIQYRDELTAAVRYLEAVTNIPSRYMLGAPRHAIEDGAFFATLRSLHPSPALLRDIEVVEKRLGASA